MIKLQEKLSEQLQHNIKINNKDGKKITIIEIQNVSKTPAYNFQFFVEFIKPFIVDGKKYKIMHPLRGMGVFFMVQEKYNDYQYTLTMQQLTPNDGLKFIFENVEPKDIVDLKYSP